MNLPLTFIKDIKSNLLYYTVFIVNFLLILYILAEACPKLPSNIKLNYNNIKGNLETGDLILFSCNDFISKGIKYTISSKYSHVGIVIKGKNDNLYILECDMTGSYDYLSHKDYKPGSHLIDLKTKIEEYDGTKFGFRKLKNNKSTISRSKLNKILKRSVLIGFQDNWITWMIAHFKNKYLGNLFNDPDYMFCTQYVAYVYQQLGILSKKNPNYLFTPKDFEVTNLNFDNGFYLDPIINFKLDN